VPGQLAKNPRVKARGMGQQQRLTVTAEVIGGDLGAVGDATPRDTRDFWHRWHLSQVVRRRRARLRRL